MIKENFDFVMQTYPKDRVTGLVFNNNREYSLFKDGQTVWSYDEASGRITVAERTVDNFNDMHRAGGISVFYNDVSNLDGITVIAKMDDEELFREMKLTDSEICILTATGGSKKETFFHRNPESNINGTLGKDVADAFDAELAKGLPYYKVNIPVAYGTDKKPGYTDYKGDEIE